MSVNELIDLSQKGILHLVPPTDNSDISEGGDFGLLNLAHGDNENIWFYDTKILIISQIYNSSSLLCVQQSHRGISCNPLCSSLSYKG